MTETESRAITMPHSRNAEESFLGAAIINCDLVRQVTLEPEDFYIHRNGFVWCAVQEIVRAGGVADYVTICARLDEKKHLAEVGGPAYIMTLIQAGYLAMNPAAYAEIIQTRARRRKIIYAAQTLAAKAFDLDADIAAGVGDALDVLAKTVISQKGATHISGYISSVYDEVDAASRNPQDIFGIPTGFSEIDNITFGLQRGEKFVLSGPPGVGKSVLAAQILINAATKGHPGALYELEMSGKQVVRRALAAHTKDKYPNDKSINITTQKMRQGRLTESEIPHFTHAVEAMEALPIYISDASEITTTEIRADLMRLIEYHGVEVCMIDYEGLLGDAPEQRDENVRSKIISKRVHDIAKDLNIAVLAIGDMTKEGIKGQVKGQGAVAGTARALHDADQIVVISKLDENGTTVRLTWEKMREGAADRFVDLVRVPGFPMFAQTRRV
jgi:replicative DNA helicase